MQRATHGSAPGTRALALSLRALALAALLAAPLASAQDFFVVDRVDSDVKRYDGSFGFLIGSVGDTGPVTNSLRAIAIHPVTGNIFLTNGASGVQEFEGTTGAFIDDFGDTDAHLTAPRELAFHPATHDLFVVDNQGGSDGTGAVRVFDGETGLYQGDFGNTQADLFTPLSLAFHPQTGDLIVSSGRRPPGQALTNGIWVIDGQTGAFVGPFGDALAANVGLGTLTFSPLSGDLFAVSNTDVYQFTGGGSWVFDDPDNPQWGATRANVDLPIAMRHHPERGSLLIVDDLNADVREFDAVSGAFVGVLGDTGTTLLSPTGIALAPPPIEVDLVLNKRGLGAIEASGSATEVPYTLVVTNTGAHTATNVTLNESLPSGATFVSANEVIVEIFGIRLLGDPIPCTPDPLGVVCDLGDLPPRLDIGVELRLSIPGGLPVGTQVQNAANVTADQDDPDNLNSSDIANVTITASTAVVPDLIGQTEEDASGITASAGFDFGSSFYLYSDSVDFGRVASQSLQPGSQAPVGSFIDVLVSIGNAAQTTVNRLPTNDPAGTPGNEWIAGWELQQWIAQSFADLVPGDGIVSSDVLIVGTTPFSGDFLSFFDSQLASAGAWDSIIFTDATALSVSGPGQTAAEAGAGSAMVRSVAPAATTTNLLVSGQSEAASGTADGYAVDEQPQLVGDPSKLVGGSSSTHILIWAPYPNDVDLFDELVLRSSWANMANVTITALFGHRERATFGDGATRITQGPATRQELRRAIQQIGPMMTPGEQFQLLVLSNGSLSRITPPFVLPAGGGFSGGGGLGPGSTPVVQILDVEDVALELLDRQPDASPRLWVGADVELAPAALFDLQIDVNACALGTLGDVAGTRRERNLPGAVRSHVYRFDVPRTCLVYPTQPVDIANPVAVAQSIAFTNLEGMEVTVHFAELNLGSIAPAQVPEPGVGLLGVAGLVVLAGLRRVAPATRAPLRPASTR